MSEWPKSQKSNGHRCGSCGDDIPVGDWYWQHSTGMCECYVCHEADDIPGHEIRGEEG